MPHSWLWVQLKDYFIGSCKISISFTQNLLLEIKYYITDLQADLQQKWNRNAKFSKIKWTASLEEFLITKHSRLIFLSFVCQFHFSLSIAFSRIFKGQRHCSFPCISIESASDLPKFFLSRVSLPKFLTFIKMSFRLNFTFHFYFSSAVDLAQYQIVFFSFYPLATPATWWDTR